MYDAMYLYGLTLNKSMNDGFKPKDGRELFHHANNMKFEGRRGIG